MDQPPYLPRDIAKADPVQALRRFVTTQAAAHSLRRPADEVARAWFGKDLAHFESVARAAVAPASTTGWGSQLIEAPVGPFIRSLRHRSAAAQLMSVSPIVDLANVGAVALPTAGTGFSGAAFVAEGSPIPAISGSFGAAIVGPPSKLAMIAGLTEDLAHYSAANAEIVIGEAMEDAATRSLDGELFSTTASSASRPAGLLNGVTPITATSGGGLAAMVKDVQNLVGAISDAGGGANIMIFANPRQIVALNALSANGVGYPIINAPSLAAGTVVAIEASAFASGFAGLPEVEVGRHAVIHYENGSPAQIGTAGSPNVVAAPAQSAWQTHSMVLRLIIPCAWTMRGTGLVQVVTGATW